MKARKIGYKPCKPLINHDINRQCVLLTSEPSVLEDILFTTQLADPPRFRVLIKIGDLVHYGLVAKSIGPKTGLSAILDGFLIMFSCCFPMCRQACAISWNYREARDGECQLTLLIHASAATAQ